MRTGLRLLAAAAFAAAAGSGAAERPTVEIVTSVGTMIVELRPDKAPRTVANFLDLVDRNFYDGLIFHRVIAGFIIQAGGFDTQFNYREAPQTVVNESAGGLANLRGSLAMARAGDPDSAGAQFYINMSDNPSLDATADQPGYTVFGKLTAGYDVAERIELVETGRAGQRVDVPLTQISILTARRVDAAERPPAAERSADN